MLGGSIGLSIATIVLNRKFNANLAGVLDPAQLRNIEQSLSTILRLNLSDRAVVGKVYAESFNEQMRLCTFLSAACVVASLGTLLRNPPSVAAAKEKQDAVMGEKEC